MKTVLILPYFGKFPNYFNLHLHTIKANPTMQWLLFTDDKTNYNFPSNVTVVSISFEEIQQLFQSKFDFKIALDSPFKLCDFRPAFGYVLQEYLKDYDYWGHCDPDILWGNFNALIDFNALSTFDKIFCFGHLTFYKNTTQNNQRFLLPIAGEERYKKVFSHPIGFAFDEKFTKSINSLYQENNIPIFLDNLVADVDSYHTNMRLTTYNPLTNSYSLEPIKKQLFVWEEGSLYRYHIDNGMLVKKEFLYIHLQKRKMNEHFNLTFPNRILISYDSFTELNEPITIANFNRHYKSSGFNKQYFKVKWNSFKYKLQFKDYFYGSKKNI